MIEVGIVTKLNNENATVKVDKKDECAKCGMCLFPNGASSISINAQNKVNAKIGDKVMIDNRESLKLLGIVLVFLVPLLIIGIAVFVGYVIIKDEILILFISLILIIFWYIILPLIDNILKKSKQFTPVIVKIISNENKENKDERNN